MVQLACGPACVAVPQWQIQRSLVSFFDTFRGGKPTHSALDTAHQCFVPSKNTEKAERAKSACPSRAVRKRIAHGPTAHGLALADASVGCRGGVSIPRRLTPPDWRMLRSPSIGLL